MTDNAKVLDRVRKLIAQANSAYGFGTEEGDHEGDTFMSRAQQMITEHAIDEALLQLDGAVREDIEVREVVVPGPHAKQKAMMLAVIGKANRVRVIGHPKGGKWYTKLVGFPSDLDSVDLLYTALLVQMVNALGLQQFRTVQRPGGSITTAQRSFMYGFMAKIRTRLAEAVAMATDEADSDTPGVALVLRDRKQEVDDVADTMSGGNRKSGKVHYNHAAATAGREAAERADIGQGRVGDGARPSLGA